MQKRRLCNSVSSIRITLEVTMLTIKVYNSAVLSQELQKDPVILKDLFSRYSSLGKQVDIASSIPTY